MPLGIAGGVPYVAMVPVGWWMRKRGAVFVIAFVASLLTFIGYLLSPPPLSPQWIVLTNRFLAIFAIWTSAIFIHYAIGARTAAHRAAARQQERAESALLESEERLQAVLDNMPANVVVKDLDGRYVFANRQFAQLVGRNARDIVGRSETDILEEHDVEAHKRHERAMLADRTPVTHETVVRQGDRVRTFLATMFPIFEADGTVRETCGISLDITERKRIEEELRQSEADLLRAQELAGLGSIHWNPVTHEVRWSDQIYEILKLPRDTAPTHAAFMGVVHPEDRQRVDAEIAPATTDSKVESRFRIIRADGVARSIHAVCETRFGNDRKPADVAITLRDETEAQLAEERLRQTHKFESLGQLASGIAHDFNNILLPIITITEVTKERLAADKAAARNLDNVLAAAHRGKHLVQQIMAFSRDQPLERQWIDVNEVVSEAIRLIRATTPPNVSIRETIETCTSRMLADPTQVHQVVVNLIANSIAAIGAHPGRIDVGIREVDAVELSEYEASSLKAERYVGITVRDTGCGMDRQTLSRVFDPFFTTRPRGEGSGLGMAVVHGIVAQHGGTVFAASEPGNGAVFKVLLPVADNVTALPARQPSDPHHLRTTDH